MAELGETTDPKQLVPGEPAEIRKSTAHLTVYGDTMRRIGDGLKKLDTGGWAGPAADAFHARFHQEPTRWLDAGDAFHNAQAAIDGYAGTLEWAQGEAATAIGLWQQGEQASTAAKAQHDQQVAAADQQAAANGQPAPPEPPFSDPGESLREQARQTLDRARAQLVTAGDQAVAVVDRAQEHAPQEPGFFGTVAAAFTDANDAISDGVQNFMHDVGKTAENVVNDVGDLAAHVVEGATDVAGTVLAGAGDLAGDAVTGLGHLTGSEDLENTGRTISQSAESLDHAIDAAGQAAGHEIRDAAHSAGEEAKDQADDVGGYLTDRDSGPHGPHYVVIDEDRYPESADHIRDAQQGEVWRGDRAISADPKPSEVTIDRDGANFNRREALRGIPGRGGEYLDRDEYPPAVFEEGGKNSSVKYIDASDNRGSGASMSNQIRGYDNGDKVTIAIG